MPSEGTGASPDTAAATSFQIGGGGGSHNAPAKTRPQSLTRDKAYLNLRDAREQDERGIWGGERGNGSVGDETATVPLAAAGVSAPVEQLNLLACVRAHHLQVARGVRRKLNGLAGQVVFWYKKPVHGEIIS